MSEQFMPRSGGQFTGKVYNSSGSELGAAGEASWGSITGTLSSQSDLNSALGGKTDTSHDHNGGDGAQIAYSSLSGTPTLGDSASKNVGAVAGTVAAGDHAHTGTYAPAANGVTNGDSHNHDGGDGAQISHASLSNLTTGDPHTQYLKETDFDDINRFGFLNQTETSLSFNDSTYIFTLADAGSGWSYWRSGLKYTISGNKTVKIADPPVDQTLYYIYIDATDGTLTASTSAWTLADTKVPVATIYWYSSLTPKYLLAEERHTCQIDRSTHRHEHTTEGTKLVSGGTVSGYTATPSSPADTDNTFAIAQTVIADEDIFQTLAALTDGNGTDNNYKIVSKNAGGYTWAASPVPFLYTTDGYIQWNNGTSMTEGGSGNFYNYFLGVSNISGDFRYFLLPGRAEHATAAAAYGEAISSFSLTSFINDESLFLYQITFGALAAYSTKGKCRIQRVARTTGNIITTTVSALTDHNTLAGIQGGTSGQYYHLTSAELTNMVSRALALSLLSLRV